MKMQLTEAQERGIEGKLLSRDDEEDVSHRNIDVVFMYQSFGAPFPNNSAIIKMFDFVENEVHPLKLLSP